MGWLRFLQVTLKLLIDWLIDCKMYSKPGGWGNISQVCSIITTCYSHVTSKHTGLRSSRLSLMSSHLLVPDGHHGKSCRVMQNQWYKTINTHVYLIWVFPTPGGPHTSVILPRGIPPPSMASTFAQKVTMYPWSCSALRSSKADWPVGTRVWE